MKKLAITLALAASLTGGNAFAQTSTSTGKGAAAGRQTASSGFAWGIAIGALAVIGVVVGVVAANSSSSFSH